MPAPTLTYLLGVGRAPTSRIMRASSAQWPCHEDHRTRSAEDTDRPGPHQGASAHGQRVQARSTAQRHRRPAVPVADLPELAAVSVAGRPHINRFQPAAVSPCWSMPCMVWAIWTTTSRWAPPSRYCNSNPARPDHCGRLLPARLAAGLRWSGPVRPTYLVGLDHGAGVQGSPSIVKSAASVDPSGHADPRRCPCADDQRVEASSGQRPCAASSASACSAPTGRVVPVRDALECLGGRRSLPDAQQWRHLPGTTTERPQTWLAPLLYTPHRWPSWPSRQAARQPPVRLGCWIGADRAG